MIVPVECQFCSNIIQKNVETVPGTESVESTINVFCPFCGKWGSGKVSGKLSLTEIQLRRDEQLKIFHLEDEKKTEG